MKYLRFVRNSQTALSTHFDLELDRAVAAPALIISPGHAGVQAPVLGVKIQIVLSA